MAQGRVPFPIATHFDLLNSNLNSENLHHPPVLRKLPKKLQNSENRQELNFYFENRYITTFMHLGHLIAVYLYLPNMILTSMKIHNLQVFKKSSIKALKTAKNRFSLHMHAKPSFAHRLQTAKMASPRTSAQNNGPRAHNNDPWV